MTMMVWLLSKPDLKILLDGQMNPIYLMFQRKLSMPLISAVPSAQTHTIANDPSPADIAASSDLSTTTGLWLMFNLRLMPLRWLIKQFPVILRLMILLLSSSDLSTAIPFGDVQSSPAVQSSFAVTSPTSSS